MSNLGTKFEKGETVLINSPGHRMDGMTGTIAYWGNFMHTWGVDIGPDNTYGFLEHELKKVAA